MTPSIAIIGGGPSGLTLARLLETKNIDYVVYERNDSESAVTQGGTLDLHPQTGQLALREAGLFEEFKKFARYDATGGCIMDQRGAVLLRAGDGRDAPEIDRTLLRKMLLDSIPSEKVKWGHGVKSVEKEDNTGGVVITFQDGSTASGFKLVVGADGSWSKVRHLLTSAKPEYSGKHFLETNVSLSNPFHLTLKALAGKGMLLSAGGGRNINAQCQDSGAYKIMVGLSIPEDFARSGVVDLSDGDATRAYMAAEYFSDWADSLRDLVLRSDGPFRAWPLYFMPPAALSWLPVKGVTLIGDAAHVTTPFVGEGVNCAMADALSLANRIAEHGEDDIDAAVAKYERDMFPRAVDLIKRSTASGNLIFADDSPLSLVESIKGNTTFLAEPLRPDAVVAE